MATDISESSGADCKGDTKNSAKLDADYPLRVLYCGGKCWDDLLTDFIPNVDSFTFGPVDLPQPSLWFGRFLVEDGGPSEDPWANSYSSFSCVSFGSCLLAWRS